MSLCPFFTYDSVLKELLLTPEGELNHVIPTIQNKIIYLLSTKLRENIVLKILKNTIPIYVPKQMKACESILEFPSAVNCTPEKLRPEILNIFLEYGLI